VQPVRHLYAHVPFCQHRCGYCDFVTVTGHADQHERYVDALLREYAAHASRGVTAAALETIYIGGGTPSTLGASLLARLLDGLGSADERTVECNPESVTDAVAAVLAERRVRVSLGAQSFTAATLRVLERRTTAAGVRDAVTRLRRAGVTNISLDLIIAVPGQSPAMLDADLEALISVQPQHASCYELEAKPGTRFTHTYGAALAAQRDSVETYYERVIDRLEDAGYAWYETASFARPGYQSAHNRAYWTGRDYLGIGIGAVSTIAAARSTNRPRLAAYLDAVEQDAPAPSVTEPLTALVRQRERLILGLRLADGVAYDDVATVIDPDALAYLRGGGLVTTSSGRLTLERRGRLLANDVVARLLRDDD
jgi:putative oxygen-independent coproporphyrinogen III oxidase